MPLEAKRLETINDLEPYRKKLARVLRRQEGNGGVERRHLEAEGLTADECTAAIALEWQMKERLAIWPGMSKEERRKVAKAAKGAKHIRAYDRTWRAARELLGHQRVAPDTTLASSTSDHHENHAPDATHRLIVSGRLYLADAETDHGKSRVVRAQSVRGIAAQWQAPTFIMDATLPDLAILQVFYPSVEVLAEIDATLPHVTVRQVLGVPVSSNKLGIVKEQGKPPRIEPPEGNRNMQAIRRAILHRWLECGRPETLVIAQKAVAEWLRASGLPAGVAVEWFNNVAGLDRYKAVGLLISIGRTLPDVFSVEAMAGALTGLEPVKTKQPDKGPRWFDRVTRGIRRKDGKAVAVVSDQHPDPVAEAVRWQVCEGELLQAIGRARGVNRTAADPLTLDIWADVVLPITVDQVTAWDDVPAGAEVEMLVAGVWLDSPADMAKVWPKVWETEAAAKQWRDRLTRSQTSIEYPLYRALGPCGRYQLPGARQKWRTARFDLSLIPDPEAWLTERLGPLAGFELIPAHLDALDRLFDAEPERAEPFGPSRFFCVEATPTELIPPCSHHGWRLGARALARGLSPCGEHPHAFRH